MICMANFQMLVKVDILPHERFDKANALIEKFSTMMKCVKHSDCPLDTKCLWPRYHEDVNLAAEGAGTYMQTNIEHINTGHLRQTRIQCSRSNEMEIADGFSLVRERLVTLTWRLHHDLKAEVFDDDHRDLVENIRVICDLKSILSKVREKGCVVYGLESSSRFLKAVRAITNTVSTISDEEIVKCYRRFLQKLDSYFRSKSIKQFDSIAIILSSF